MDEHKIHKKVFLKVLFINIVVFLAELVVALYSGSLTMLSDSFHVFLHIVASLIGFVSEFEFLGLASEKIKTYTALMNIALFFVSAGIIAKEATGRLSNSPDLRLDRTFFIVAFIGLAANIYSAKIIPDDEHGECHQNLGIFRACMIYDAVSSVIVIGGSIAMYFTGIFVLDPILSIILALLMILRGGKLLRTVSKPKIR